VGFLIIMHYLCKGAEFGIILMLKSYKRMKKTVFIFFLSLCLPFGVYSQASLIFQRTFHDFGTIKEELGKVSTRFYFVNKGTEPIVLRRVQPSCGCTTSEWSKEPIAVGDTGVIQITYDLVNRPGAFEKSIYVYSNAKTVELSIKGKVIPHEVTIEEMYPIVIKNLRLSTDKIDFGMLLDTQSQKFKIKIYNTSSENIAVKFSNVPKYITIDAPKTIPSNEEVVITFSIHGSKCKQWGNVKNEIQIVEKKKVIKKITIKANIKEDFSKLTKSDLKEAPKVNFSTNAVVFELLKQPDNKQDTITVTNKGKKILEIRKIISHDECISATFKNNKIKGGASSEIIVNLNSVKTLGKREHVIEVITNDPKNPIQTIRVSSNVQK